MIPKKNSIIIFWWDWRKMHGILNVTARIGYGGHPSTHDKASDFIDRETCVSDVIACSVLILCSALRTSFEAQSISLHHFENFSIHSSITFISINIRHVDGYGWFVVGHVWHMGRFKLSNRFVADFKKSREYIVYCTADKISILTAKHRKWHK